MKKKYLLLITLSFTTIISMEKKNLGHVFTPINRHALKPTKKPLILTSSSNTRNIERISLPERDPFLKIKSQEIISKYSFSPKNNEIKKKSDPRIENIRKLPTINENLYNKIEKNSLPKIESETQIIYPSSKKYFFDTKKETENNAPSIKESVSSMNITESYYINGSILNLLKNEPDQYFTIFQELIEKETDIFIKRRSSKFEKNIFFYLNQFIFYLNKEIDDKYNGKMPTKILDERIGYFLLLNINLIKKIESITSFNSKKFIEELKLKSVNFFMQYHNKNFEKKDETRKPFLPGYALDQGWKEIEKFIIASKLIIDNSLNTKATFKKDSCSLEGNGLCWGGVSLGTIGLFLLIIL